MARNLQQRYLQSAELREKQLEAAKIKWKKDNNKRTSHGFKNAPEFKRIINNEKSRNYKHKIKYAQELKEDEELQSGKGILVRNVFSNVLYYQALGYGDNASDVTRDVIDVAIKKGREVIINYENKIEGLEFKKTVKSLFALDLIFQDEWLVLDENITGAHLGDSADSNGAVVDLQTIYNKAENLFIVNITTKQ